MKLTNNRVLTLLKKNECSKECIKSFKAEMSRKISPRSGKNKGARLQKEVGQLFAKEFDLVFGVDEDIASREMGQSGTDLRLSRHARTIVPFDVECKNAETWSVSKWWEQCLSNTAKDRLPLLVVSKNGHENLAIVRVEDLVSLTKGDYSDN